MGRGGPRIQWGCGGEVAIGGMRCTSDGQPHAWLDPGDGASASDLRWVDEVLPANARSVVVSHCNGVGDCGGDAPIWLVCLDLHNNIYYGDSSTTRTAMSTVAAVTWSPSGLGPGGGGIVEQPGEPTMAATGAPAARLALTTAVPQATEAENGAAPPAPPQEPENDTGTGPPGQ